MSERRWRDILWEVQPPSEQVLGWMDWPTGILYLNHSVEAPDEFMDMVRGESRDDQDRELLATITHENMHFLQVVTTGFMYRWVAELYGLLVRAMKPFVDELGAYVDKPDPRFLIKIRDRISAEDRRDLHSTLARIDTPGPNSVTVRALLESHAFLVEKMSHFEGLDAEEYVRMLDEEASGPEYRLAYDLARFRLGDGAAFAYFSLIVSICLCDEDPATAFDVVIDEMATWQLSQQPEEIDSEFTNKIALMLPRPIGTSAEAAEQIRIHHPIYKAAVYALNERCSEGFNVRKFFADPVSGVEIIAHDVLRPMVFRANSKEQFGIFVPQGFDRKMIEPMLIYSVLSSRVLGSASASIAAVPAEAGSYEWLAHIQQPLAGLEIGTDLLLSCELSALAKLQITEAAKNRELAGLLGRCLLSFDVDAAEPVWVREDVRRFVQALERENPAFPAFLCMQPAYGMFVVWFASLAERSALQGKDTTLDLTHDSVVSHLVDSIGAIHQTMQAAGWASRPALQALLTSYPRDMKEKLLGVLLNP